MGGAHADESNGWRDAELPGTELSLAMRQLFKEDTGPITFSGRLSAAARGDGGSYEVVVTTTSPAGACPRYPPDAVFDGAIVNDVSGARFEGSVYRDDATDDPIPESRLRACGYLVRVGSAGSQQSPAVVARAQKVGTPRGNPSDLVVGLILALLTAIGVLVYMWHERWSPQARSRRPPPQPGESASERPPEPSMACRRPAVATNTAAAPCACPHPAAVGDGTDELPRAGATFGREGQPFVAAAGTSHMPRTAAQDDLRDAGGR